MDHSAWGLVRRNNGAICSDPAVVRARLNFPTVDSSDRLTDRVRVRDARNARHVA